MTDAPQKFGSIEDAVEEVENKLNDFLNRHEEIQASVRSTILFVITEAQKIPTVLFEEVAMVFCSRTCMHHPRHEDVDMDRNRSDWEEDLKNLLTDLYKKIGVCFNKREVVTLADMRFKLLHELIACLLRESETLGDQMENISQFCVAPCRL